MIRRKSVKKKKFISKKGVWKSIDTGGGEVIFWKIWWIKNDGAVICI